MAKKKLATVQLSNQVCLFCEKTGVLLTNEDPVFASAVCPEHMMKLLRKWEPAPNGNGDGATTSQASKPPGELATAR